MKPATIAELGLIDNFPHVGHALNNQFFEQEER